MNLVSRVFASVCCIVGLVVCAIPGRSQTPIAPSASTASEDAASVVASALVVKEFITKINDHARTIHQNSKNVAAPAGDGCRTMLNEIFDLNVMAQVATADFLDQMTLRQREAFRMAFEHRMIAHCMRQFESYDGEAIKLAGVRTTDNGLLLVTTRFGSPEDGRLVTWHLQNSDRCRVVDIIIEGRSVVTDARSEFAAVLESANGDIEALIAFIQK